MVRKGAISVPEKRLKTLISRSNGKLPMTETVVSFIVFNSVENSLLIVVWSTQFKIVAETTPKSTPAQFLEFMLTTVGIPKEVANGTRAESCTVETKLNTG